MENNQALGELLIADDDQPFLDLLARTFGRDFTVHTAADGQRALELLEQTHPIAILSDEMMPFATGSQVLARARERHPHAARMLMTASTDFAHVVNAINQGEIHRFFSKPLRPLELRTAVLAAVERARGEEMLRADLATLTRLKTPAVTKPRVLLACVDHAAVAALQAACALRGYDVVADNSVVNSQALITNKGVDVVIAGGELGATALAGLVSVGRAVDESMAFLMVDTAPSLQGATLAMELGLSDYLSVPLPAAPALAERLERALHPHVLVKDMQRVQADLLLANRELVRARRKTEEQQVRVLNAMVRALEARDAYTAGHTDRVAGISVRIGEVLRLSAERLAHLRIGALLHDIGKIGVRDAVLLKPARLSPEEFELIKVHTTLGSDLLKDVEQFRCVVPIIRAHHERMDGSGYPDGLSGLDIPQEARIVAVADILDAVTSTRPYRLATSADSAFEIIISQRGQLLDADAVDAAVMLRKQGRLDDLLQFPSGTS